MPTDTSTNSFTEIILKQARDSIVFSETYMDMVKDITQSTIALPSRDLSNLYFLLSDLRSRLIQRYFKKESHTYSRYTKHLPGTRYKKENEIFFREVIANNPQYLQTVTVPKILVSSVENLLLTVDKKITRNIKNMYIVQKNGEFYTSPDNTFIQFNKNSNGYKIFVALYKLVSGDGTVSLALLAKELPWVSKDVKKFPDKFKKYVQNNLVNKESTFFRTHKQLREINGKPLFFIPHGTKMITFSNMLK